MWKDIGYLGEDVITLDAFRKPQKTIVYKLAMCHVIGVKRSEFYQAMTAGFKPELSVEIKSKNYNKEPYFKYDGTVYRVLRIYPVKNEAVELTCTALVIDDD